MNVFNLPSERFEQTDKIINFEEIAPSVPTEPFSIRTISTLDAWLRQAGALLQHKHHLNI